MTPANKYLIVVIGPTAIGKTSAAIKIAQHFNCEIISCDSRQFFREMSIGTAVPSPDELAAARHHFIHNKSIFENYTVGDFEKEAIATLDKIFETGDYAVMVGGSGLYVDAILKGFDEFPEIDLTIRKTIGAHYEQSGISFLQHELRKLDPDYFDIVDTENPQRLMRALEVTLGSGRPYSTFLTSKTNDRHFVSIIIGLEADRAIIYDRINQRVDLMMQEGLLDEAGKLRPHKNLNALQTVGYRELFSYFEGEMPLDFAVSEIKKNTRRFAKRQLTWFKRNDVATWFDYQTPASEIISFIQSEIKNK